MKGRQPILITEEDAIHFFIGVYYQECSKAIDIRFNEKEHMELITHINKRYLHALKRHKEFDYEKYENAFMECIDFLTKIITKRREKKEQSENKKKFLNKIFK